MAIERRPGGGPEGRISTNQYRDVIEGARRQLTERIDRYGIRNQAARTLPAGRREVEERALKIEGDELNSQAAVLDRLAAKIGTVK